MFEINLLTRPGLQETAAEPEAGELLEREAEIVNRLEARIPPETPPIAVAIPRAKSRFRPWMVILLVIVAAAAYWWYQGWSWNRFREFFPFLEAPPSTEVPEVTALRPGACAAVMARFLEELPSRASLDFMDIGAGVLIYRVWGQELAQSLLQLNAGVEGCRFSDLITPSILAASGGWLGTVAFASEQQVGAMRPVMSDYDRFFRQLQDKVRSTGGVVVEMVPGTMTAGEYVIRGSLDEIQAHLAAMAGDSLDVHYHRMSLLKSVEPAGRPYLLRVIFNIIEEPTPSPQSSLPEGTGA